MLSRSLAISLIGLTLATPASRANPRAPVKRPDASTLLPLLAGGSVDALAGSLRGGLVRLLPDPLYETSPGWGHTTEVSHVQWKGQGLNVHPEHVKVARNDGKWRHIRVSAVNPADTLVLDIRDLQQPEPGRLTFTTFLSCDARVEYDRQNWDKGIRLYSGSARARFRIKATLYCEASFQLVSGSLLVPDAVFRLRVVRSDVNYDNFVMEHAAGVGGEAAKVLGDAGRGGLHKWHPALEHKMLERANAAIEKAADTKEVRLSVSDLLKSKGWLPAAP
jgi:hypothetical protein